MARAALLLVGLAAAQGLGVSAPTPKSCDQCLVVASRLTSYAHNKTAVAEKMHQVQHECDRIFGSKSSLDKTCRSMGAAAVKVVPLLVKQLDALAWDDHAICAALNHCTAPCCSTASAPEQLRLSLTGKPSEMSVMWTTLEDTKTHTVRWGSQPTELSQTASGSSDTYKWFGWIGRLHHAVMTGLEPGKTYYYSVGDAAGGFSDVRSFTTFPKNIGSAERPLKLIQVADMGYGPNSNNTVMRMIQLVESGAIDMVLHVGDISYADGDMQHWDVFLRKVEQVTSRVPYMTVPGNHEFFFNFAAYKHRFAMPPTKGGDGWGHYSFEVGPVHFVGMNTESAIDTTYMSTAQLKWLSADFSAARQAARPWVVAYGHRPVYCSQQHGQDLPRGTKVLQRDLEPLLLKDQVDIIITGHVHDYERTWPVAKGQPTAENYVNPAAPVYVVNGAAGNREGNDKPPGGFPWCPPKDAAQGLVPRSHEISYAVLTITPQTLQWEQFDSASGSRFDTFTIVKNTSSATEVVV